MTKIIIDKTSLENNVKLYIYYPLIYMHIIMILDVIIKLFLVHPHKQPLKGETDEPMKRNKLSSLIVLGSRTLFQFANPFVHLHLTFDTILS